MTTEENARFEQHVREALSQPGVRQLPRSWGVGQSADMAVAVTDDGDDMYITLYDTLDGHPLRVPESDRRYMLAKRRPVIEGERVVWRRIEGRKNAVYQTAPGGTVPAYSETPVQAGSKVEQFATDHGAKAPTRRRRRGARGARRRQNAS